MTVAELIEELKKVDPKNQVELEITNPETTQGVIGNGPMSIYESTRPSTIVIQVRHVQVHFTWSADFSGL